MNAGRRAGVLLVGIIAGIFAYLNAGERVALHLGFTEIYRLPLGGVVLGSFLLGMITMFLLSLPVDRRVRRILLEQERRARGSTGADPPIDVPR